MGDAFSVPFILSFLSCGIRTVRFLWTLLRDRWRERERDRARRKRERERERERERDTSNDFADIFNAFNT